MGYRAVATVAGSPVLRRQAEEEIRAASSEPIDLLVGVAGHVDPDRVRMLDPLSDQGIV